MVIVAVFTIAKIWKQPKCPSLEEWAKQSWYLCTMIYYLAIKKEGNLIYCNSMDGPGEHYAKGNKPGRERQIPYDFIHMGNLMNKLN